MAHALTRCDHCQPELLPSGAPHPGDDHPKWHWGEQTFHHDCAPVQLLALHPEDHVVHAIRAAAESGIRGDALREHIVTVLHPDQTHQEG
jgi:hypothetical protein